MMAAQGKKSDSDTEKNSKPYTMIKKTQTHLLPPP